MITNFSKFGILHKRKQFIDGISPSANQTLITYLATATSKADWISKLAVSLGDPITATVRHAPTASNGTALDLVWIDGATVMSVTFTGGLTSANNVVTSMGTISSSVFNNADLTQGAAVIRFTGNGNYIQGSFGIGGTGRNFLSTGSPSGFTGVTFSSVAIYPPSNLA